MPLFRLQPLTVGQPGGKVSIPLYLDADGWEVGLTFGIKYDPNILSNPVIAKGAASNQLGANIVPNYQSSNGEIIADVYSSSLWGGNNNEVAIITFDINTNVANASIIGNSTPLTFDPNFTMASSAGGGSTPINGQGGAVEVDYVFTSKPIIPVNPAPVTPTTSPVILPTANPATPIISASPTPTPTQTPGTSLLPFTLPDNIAGIPILWIGLGLGAWFLLKK